MDGFLADEGRSVEVCFSMESSSSSEILIQLSSKVNQTGYNHHTVIVVANGYIDSNPIRCTYISWAKD